MLALIAITLPAITPTIHAESIPSPLQQIQSGVSAVDVKCAGDRTLVLSPSGRPACINESSVDKLAILGWNAVTAPQTDPKKTAPGDTLCRDSQKINSDKFDYGLLDAIDEMLDANITRHYSVLLTVSDADRQTVENILNDCYDAEDVTADTSSSFVTASVPLEEVSSLSAYPQIQHIGEGELFVIPPTLDNVEGTTWVQIDPIQCGGNMWGDARSSPDHIKGYFADQDVIVLDVKTEQTYQVVCAACSCPDGITLYLQVSDDDVSTMQNWGFSLLDK